MDGVCRNLDHRFFQCPAIEAPFVAANSGRRSVSTLVVKEASRVAI